MSTFSVAATIRCTRRQPQTAVYVRKHLVQSLIHCGDRVHSEQNFDVTQVTRVNFTVIKCLRVLINVPALRSGWRFPATVHDIDPLCTSHFQLVHAW